MCYVSILGRVAIGVQRPIVVKLSRERRRSVGLSVCLSVQCIVEKRRTVYPVVVTEFTQIIVNKCDSHW